jgi:hypothetical protein
MDTSPLRAEARGTSYAKNLDRRPHMARTPSGRDGEEERVMGLEPSLKSLVSSTKPLISEPGAAEASVAVSPPMPADDALRQIVDAWPALPDAIKAGILAMVTALKS